MHCVDLGESFQTHMFLQNLASIQPRTSPLKFTRFRLPGLPVSRGPSLDESVQDRMKKEVLRSVDLLAENPIATSSVLELTYEFLQKMRHYKELRRLVLAFSLKFPPEAFSVQCHLVIIEKPDAQQFGTDVFLFRKRIRR